MRRDDVQVVCSVRAGMFRLRRGVAVQTQDFQWFYIWCGPEVVTEILGVLSWLDLPVEHDKELTLRRDLLTGRPREPR